MQVSRGIEGRGSSGGSSRIVSGGYSHLESLRQSSDVIPQGDSLGGYLRGAYGGRVKGKRMSSACSAIPIETTTYTYRTSL